MDIQAKITNKEMYIINAKLRYTEQKDGKINNEDCRRQVIFQTDREQNKQNKSVHVRGVKVTIIG